MKANIISQNQVFSFEDFLSITLPGLKEQFSVLPYHTPLIASLGQGKIRVKDKNKEKFFNIKRGVLEVSDKKVDILADLEA